MKLHPKQTVVAIDPGKSGAIVVYFNNRVQTVAKMPEDSIGLKKFFQAIKKDYGNIIIFCEQVSAYASGDSEPGKKFGINKMLKNLNELHATFNFLALRWVPVYAISWQNTLDLKLKRPKNITPQKFKSVRKNHYKKYAETKFPSVKVTLTNADALCILQFAIVKLFYNKKWVLEKMNVPPNTDSEL